MITIISSDCSGSSYYPYISTLEPSFSWKTICTTPGSWQRAYQIKIALDEAGENLLINTGWKETTKSTHVRLETVKFEEGTRYFYQIKIKDNQGNESAWSNCSWFETVFSGPNRWKAPFISPCQEIDKTSSSGWRLRRKFHIQEKPVSARAYVTALGVYEFYINSPTRGDWYLLPGWTSYHNRVLFQTYDITDQLVLGDNCLGIQLGPGWYKGDLAGWIGLRNLYGERNAVSAQIYLKYSDDREEWLYADDQWKSAGSPILYSEIYHGEKYRASLEDQWVLPSYDDSKWQPCETIDAPPREVLPQDCPPISIQEKLKVTQVLSDSKGRTILDFGQNIAGVVQFSVEGPAGSKVVLKHGELLTPQGDLYTENLRTAEQTIVYHLKGNGVESYRPFFTFQGFRYVLVEEHPGEIRPENFKALVIHSTMGRTGYFSCSDQRLNRLHENILWSMKGNFIDIPTDCPQRDERLGWTGDAQVFCSTANILMDTCEFFNKWLRDVAEEQREDGGVHHVVPNILPELSKGNGFDFPNHSAAGWADAAVIIPWQLYLSFGDIEILRRHFKMMTRWMDYLESAVGEKGLWDSGFHFGDWVALDAEEGSYFGATPNEFTASAFACNSAKIMSKVCKILDNHKRFQKCEQLHMKLKKAIQKAFFSETGELIINTQTAHILALEFQLFHAGKETKVADGLQKLLEKSNYHLSTGFLGTPYICSALSKYNKSNLAWKLLFQDDYPSWLYQVARGATTIWEHWDGIKPDGSLWSPDMNSFNHYAYGSIGNWLYSNAAGIRPCEDEPGYKTIYFCPTPSTLLKWAEASIDTPYGKTSCKWSIRGKTLEVEIEVPFNCKGKIILHATEMRFSDNVQFEMQDNQFVATVNSGNYHFSCEMNMS